MAQRTPQQRPTLIYLDIATLITGIALLQTNLDLGLVVIAIGLVLELVWLWRLWQGRKVKN